MYGKDCQIKNYEMQTCKSDIYCNDRPSICKKLMYCNARLRNKKQKQKKLMLMETYNTKPKM